MADPPPDGNHSQWRDPTTAWIAPDTKLGNNTYWAAVGAQQDCVGGAALYASADFLAWEYRGVLFSQTSLGGASCAPSGDTCDQFSGCPMNECPDYFTLGNVSVIKYSDQVGGLWDDMFSWGWLIGGGVVIGDEKMCSLHALVPLLLVLSNDHQHYRHHHHQQLPR